MTERSSFLRANRLAAAMLLAAVALCSVFACATTAQADQSIVTDLGTLGIHSLASLAGG